MTQEGLEETRHCESLGEERLVWASRATASPLLNRCQRPLVPRAESLGKGRRIVCICSCDFTSETHPQSLGLGAHFSGYCLELSLWIYLVWRFKGEALCLELRKPRPAASKTICPHPPPSFQPSLLASARLEALGGFARSFRYKELPLAHPGGDHSFPECHLPLSLNNQGGDTS